MVLLTFFSDSSLLLPYKLLITVVDRRGTQQVLMDEVIESAFQSSVKGFTDILSSILTTCPHLANTPFKGLLPLIAASSNGHVEAVKILLDHGAMVNAQDKNEEFALLVASLNGHTEVIKVLITHGAKLDLTSQAKGKSALHAASETGNLKSVKALLAHGADVECEDINGWSPLFVAAKSQHLQVVKCLLQHGANPNVKDMAGLSPLIRASTLGYTKIVEALLDGEAQVDIQNNEGLSPLNIASLKGFTQIVHTLLEYGAQINLTTKHNRTALQSACFAGHIDIVWTLLNLGAKDPGLCALLIAILKDQQEIVKLFIKFGDSAHPNAVKVASTVDKATLLKMSAEKIGKLAVAEIPKTAKSQQDIEMEEIMDMQKLILETVNSLHFQSKTSRRAGLFELAPEGKRGPTLQVVLREFMLLYLAVDWQTIGTLLGLPAVQLRAIKNDNRLARNCMREMLEVWLNTTDPAPTWEKLVEAVGILDEANAQYLHKKFCT